MFYRKFGNGPELLIALHGFGDDSRTFLALAAALERQFTVYAVDLPFHGQTTWPGESFSQSDLVQQIDQIMRLEHRKTCSLMGYSFGARLILGMVSTLSPKMEHLYFIAPDGLHTKGMFAAHKMPLWFRRFLFKMTKNSNLLVNAVQKLASFGLFPLYLSKFIAKNLDSPAHHRRVFGCWLAMPDFSFSIKNIQSILREAAIPVDIYLGERDKIIPFRAVQKTADGFSHCHVHILPVGHKLVGQELCKYLHGNTDIAAQI